VYIVNQYYYMKSLYDKEFPPSFFTQILF